MVSSVYGAAVVHGNTAYFSQNHNVYSYMSTEDRWNELENCEYSQSSLAKVNDKVTTIGGLQGSIATNFLLSLAGGPKDKSKWERLLPPMPTASVRPATVTTPTHLIVTGGTVGRIGGALSSVEVLDTSTLQWSSASSSPIAMKVPHMTICDGLLYLSQHSTVFSASLEDLLKFCKPEPPSTGSSGSVWTQLADIPVRYWASLTTLRGRVLAIGGIDQLLGNTPIGVIHCYNKSTNSWSVIGEMPTPRYDTLLAVLPSNELIMIGGWDNMQMWIW